MDSDVVKRLLKSIKEVMNVDAKPMGVGGGTCAAFFRHRGLRKVIRCVIFLVQHLVYLCYEL